MDNKNTRIRFRLNLIGVLVLVFGLTGSAVLFLTGADDQSDVIGYEIVDGKAYPITTSDSKRYRHDVERFGGKAAVFADDLGRWLTSLWHGKRLAFTLAVLTVGATFACFRAAEQIAADPSDEDKDGREG